MAHCNQLDSIQTSWYTVLSWNFGNVVHENCWDFGSNHGRFVLCVVCVWVRSCARCVCECVCVCVCVLASACVRAVHKSTAVNIYRLRFVIDYNNTGIKSKILNINLYTIVHPLRNKAALHCMSDRGYADGDCFPLGSWESSWDGESERYEWNGWMYEWINEGLNGFINGSGKWAYLFIAARRRNIQYTSKYHFLKMGS